MASRKKIPSKIETEVLVRSRRRCCVCYGLSKDETTKNGQIAHLDHDPLNNNFDNLSFMCLEHHDEYDGKTSQSKNLMIKEVKRHRNELYEKSASSNLDRLRTELPNGVGGLVGELNNGNILDSTADVEIVGGGQAKGVGGLVGRMSGGTIKNSHAKGKIILNPQRKSKA